ncbi:ArsC/Spx/MgsR family protein [Marinicella sp. W31]|uniref:ArsC/Spx/MgsR family protein n=1 Tax=Marinicella sp. W31 TaxID=3023713 RepID=UPI003756D05A
MMQIYGIKNCDKVRAAMRWGQEQGLDVQLHDYRVDGLDAQLLDTFIQHFPLETLVNKRSTSWRGLSDEQRAQLTPEVILEQPTLIKRPLVKLKQDMILGFEPDQWKQLI